MLGRGSVMKRNSNLASDFSRGITRHFSADKLFIYLFLLSFMLPACSGKMSVEEARKVTVDLSKEAFVPPPRRIDDILAALEQSGQYDTEISKKFRAELSKPRPQTDDEEILANYYLRRGAAALESGRHVQALADLRLALDYYSRTGGLSPKLLRYLGIAEYAAGNFRQAIERLKQAKRKEVDGSPLTFNFLVSVFARVGDLDSAEKYKKQGIDLCNHLKNQSGWKWQQKWLNIYPAQMEAYVLTARGKFLEAEPYYRRILQNLTPAIRKQVPSAYINFRSNLSINLKNQNRLIEAEAEVREIIKEAIADMGRDSEITGLLISHLGEIFLRQGRLLGAEKLMRAGLRTVERADVSPDSYMMARVRMQLGEVLAAREKFNAAMRQFDLARSGMQQNQFLYEKHFARSPSLVLSLVRTGRIEEAEKQISAIYAQNRKLLGAKHYLTAEALGFRGMVYALQENDQKALKDFSETLPILLAPGSSAKVSYGSQLRRKIIAESNLGLLAKVHGTDLEKTAGIDASLEAFKLADALSGSAVRGAIGASTVRAAVSSPELADLVRQEQDAQKQLKLLEIALTDNLTVPQDQQLPEVIQALKMKIDTLRRARLVLVDEIKTRFPKYAELTNPKPGTISLLQEHLRPEEAFISIYTADDESYVWVIPHEGQATFSAVPLGRGRLSQMVADLRKSLDPKPQTLGDIPEFDTHNAYDLYRQLLMPVERGWKDATDLLIVAHGPLGQLPFAVLPTAPVLPGADQKVLFSRYKKVPWLIRKASITRLPSASTFVNLRTVAEGDPGRKPFAGFGDPFFNEQQQAEAQKEKAAVATAGREGYLHVRGVRLSKEGILDSDNIVSCTINNLNRLPDTSAEIKHIANALGADPVSDVFLGQQANEQQVKSMDLSDRKVIAFATHALVPGDLNGLDQPALALSSPSITGDNEDGLLTMGEILRLKLNADWVVLSACNTGAAEGKGAEAISGLGRAFFYAGTRALLVSMWPVETTSASELTTGLFRYQQREPSLSRARALQKSALALIDGPGLKDQASGKIVASYAHPLFWAPFIIVGESASHTH